MFSFQPLDLSLILFLNKVELVLDWIENLLKQLARGLKLPNGFQWHPDWLKRFFRHYQHIRTFLSLSCWPSLDLDQFRLALWQESLHCAEASIRGNNRIKYNEIRTSSVVSSHERDSTLGCSTVNTLIGLFYISSFGNVVHIVFKSIEVWVIVCLLKFLFILPDHYYGPLSLKGSFQLLLDP